MLGKNLTQNPQQYLYFQMWAKLPSRCTNSVALILKVGATILQANNKHCGLHYRKVKASFSSMSFVFPHLPGYSRLAFPTCQVWGNPVWARDPHTTRAFKSKKKPEHWLSNTALYFAKENRSQEEAPSSLHGTHFSQPSIVYSAPEMKTAACHTTLQTFSAVFKLVWFF